MAGSGYILITLEFVPEGSKWVGTCRELGTSMFGDTVDEAKEALIEAVELHLNALESVGERKRFFQRHGVRFYKRRPHYRASRADIPFDQEVLIGKQLMRVP